MNTPQQMSMPFGEPTFREPVPEDVDEIVEMAEGYWVESEWSQHMDFDEQAVRDRFDLTMAVPSLKCVLFCIDDIPHGIATFSYDRMYSKEKTCTVNLLYVEPPFRRGPVGRRLMDIVEAMAQNDGCVAVDVNFASGIDSSRQTFENLFEKRGYVPTWAARKYLGEPNHV